jgi:hypothetical protein
VSFLIIRFWVLYQHANIVIAIVKTADAARDQLDLIQSRTDCCLVIDGESLQVGFHSEWFLACLDL